jgi:hypothetical protein
VGTLCAIIYAGSRSGDGGGSQHAGVRITCPLEWGDIPLYERGGVGRDARIQLEQLHEEAHEAGHNQGALHEAWEAKHAVLPVAAAARDKQQAQDGQQDGAKVRSACTCTMCVLGADMAYDWC